MSPVRTTTSARRFIEQAADIATETAFCLASLDFDYAGVFLKRYGTLSVETAIQRAWAAIEAGLGGLKAVVLHSSLDETEIVVSTTDPEVLGARLTSLAGAVRALGPRFFPEDAPPFGFTAAIAGCGTIEGDGFAERLRALAAANLTELAYTKEQLGRGRVRITPSSGVAPGQTELAQRVWRRLNATTASSFEASRMTPSAFKARIEAAPPACIALVLPRFGGAVFDASVVREGDGSTLLPDGSLAGKLGFVNRLFGEHLTPDLVTEAVFAALWRSRPWRSDPPMTWSSSSLLCGVTGEDERNGLEARLRQWAKNACDAVNDVLAPELTLATLQVALVRPEAAVLAIDLAHRVFRIEGTVYHSGPLFVHDLRGQPPATFQALAEDYRVATQVGPASSTSRPPHPPPPASRARRNSPLSVDGEGQAAAGVRSSDSAPSKQQSR